MTIDLNTFVSVAGFLITIFVLVWKLASVKNEIDHRLTVLETEFKCFTKRDVLK